MALPLLVRALVVATLLLSANVARAELTVPPRLAVRNETGKNLVIAVRYKHANSGWQTSPFMQVPANKVTDLNVYSNNSVFYFYAESTSGKPSKWEGENKYEVDGKSYLMRKTTLPLNEKSRRYTLRLFLSSGPTPAKPATKVIDGVVRKEAVHQ